MKRIQNTPEYHRAHERPGDIVNQRPFSISDSTIGMPWRQDDPPELQFWMAKKNYDALIERTVIEDRKQYPFDQLGSSSPMGDPSTRGRRTRRTNTSGVWTMRKARALELATRSASTGGRAPEIIAKAEAFIEWHAGPITRYRRWLGKRAAAAAEKHSGVEIDRLSIEAQDMGISARPDSDRLPRVTQMHPTDPPKPAVILWRIPDEVSALVIEVSFEVLTGTYRIMGRGGVRIPSMSGYLEQGAWPMIDPVYPDIDGLEINTDGTFRFEVQS